MSAAASPRGKSTVAADVDSIMPLLFATIGNPSISFKKMAAMDAEKRTDSSLEHKFRKWRQMGREIAEKNPEHAGTFAAVTPKKTRSAPVKNGAKGKSKAKQADVGEEEGAIDEDEGFAAVKLENTDDISANCTKKRSVSKDAEDGTKPAKKAKVAKKGTAKVLRKPAAKAREPSESASAEDAFEYEEEKEAAPKANRRSKAGRKPTISNMKSEVSNTQGRVALRGGDEASTDAEDDEVDEKVPLKFEQDA